MKTTYTRGLEVYADREVVEEEYLQENDGGKEADVWEGLGTCQLTRECCPTCSPLRIPESFVPVAVGNNTTSLESGTFRRRDVRGRCTMFWSR